MALPFEAWVDKELGVMHVRRECPGLKIPFKYHYAEMHMVRTVEQARELDERYRPCEACKKELERKRDPSIDRKFHYRRNKQEEKL